MFDPVSTCQADFQIDFLCSPGCELCTKWGCKKYGNLGIETSNVRDQILAVPYRVMEVMLRAGEKSKCYIN